MNDPIVAARALIESGDLAGAERVLAQAITAGHDVHRAVRALAAICLRSGEIGFRAQQAFDAFVARGGASDDDRAASSAADRAGAPDADRAGASDDDRAAMLMLARLYRELGVRDAALEAYDALLARAHDDTAQLERDELAASMPMQQINELPSLEGFAPLPAAPKLSVPEPTEPIARPATGPGPKSSSKSSSETPFRVGEIFRAGARIQDRYEIEQRVGKGGHATVLRVRDTVLDEICALKVFHDSGDANDVARFKREVSLSRRVVHENVVKLYDIGQEQGFWFLTMELLEGDDLATVLKRDGSELRSGLRWMVDACRGLNAAHVQGIVHRDVKPANMFIECAGRLKLMDFGIAKPLDATTLTTTGVFVGTPQYVSPEQVQGLDVTPQSDIYSLGVVMYVLATGTLPFQEKQIVALLMQHLQQAPEPPSARNPRVPALLEALIMGCLEKRPKDRPTDCLEVADTLEQLLARL